ncbi:MAG TPA: glutathione transferase GstA [Woeseiaceae bacterium]|nr:glutathione transferase GstA [Woeseiaceae bacterium]
MKLYYSPGACSLSPHIVAIEAGIPLELVRVDTRTKTMRKDGDFWAVNPKGYVPALELEDGAVLTEGPAVVQYLADLRPEAALAPANGTLERVRLQEMLNFITSEIHKSYTPLFNPNVHPATREERIVYLQKRYGFLEKHLEGRKYLLGDRFTVADAYLFVVTTWARIVDVDLSGFPNILAFQKRIGGREAVLRAMRAEGLIEDVESSRATSA